MFAKPPLVLALLSCMVLVGCQKSGLPTAGRSSVDPQAPHLFDAMGDHHRPVTTASPMAQKWFDHGLIWAYAFNHGEAIRCFRAALKEDPNLAMAWWGIALCNGPHINNPSMTAQNYADAWEAVGNARRLAAGASSVEKALIEAIATRYAPSAPADRAPLDKAYAAAMAKVHETCRADADVAVLYAEAMMDLQPWDLWTKDGKPKGQAEKIVAVLEDAIRHNPNHPGALHLYIHAVEASQQPGRAMAAADRLRNLVPAAGHLVHMPSHIDVRTGKWAEASDANQRAIETDVKYRQIRPRSGFWNVYMLHNRHFLAYSAMMEGRRDVAIKAAREMVASVPVDWAMENAAIADAYMAIPYESLMRFGLWDQILVEPAPPAYLPITTALWHFTRGIAHAAKGDVKAANAEHAAFALARAKLAPDAHMAINPAKNVLDLADHVLQGEIAFREGKLDGAISHLNKAIALEDDLQYMEPPDWVHPGRHILGAFLVSAQRYSEAEKVYRQDLEKWPENGWALYGLATALGKQGKTAEASAVEKRFKAAWARADTQLASSCFCVAGE